MALSLLAIGICVYFASLKFSVTNDDAFITFTYARNLAEGRGLVFNDGERVLGTTSPLYALILGALRYSTGVSVPLLAKWVCILCLAGASWLLYLLLRNRTLAHVGFLLPPLVFFNKSVHYGTGNEVPLLMLSVTASLLLYRRGNLRAALAVGALSYLVRGEGIIVLCVILVHYLWVKRRWPRWTDLLPSVVLLIAWHSFAWLYFHTFLPNTVLAKTAYKYTQSFFSELPMYAYWIFRLDAHGVLMGVFILIGVLVLLKREPLVVGYVIAHLAGYSVIGAGSHSWYYHSLGYLWAISLAVGGAWLAFKLVPKRLPALNMTMSLGLAVVFFSVSPILVLHRQDDQPRYDGYLEVLSELKRHTAPSDMILAQEVGILGYHLDNKILDSDFLVGRRPSDFDPLKRVEFILSEYDPSVFVTTDCRRPDGRPLRAHLFQVGDRSYCFRLRRLIRREYVRLGIYSKADCSRLNRD